MIKITLKDEVKQAIMEKSCLKAIYLHCDIDKGKLKRWIKDNNIGLTQYGLLLTISEELEKPIEELINIEY